MSRYNTCFTGISLEVAESRPICGNIYGDHCFSLNSILEDYHNLMTLGGQIRVHLFTKMQVAELGLV